MTQTCNRRGVSRRAFLIAAGAAGLAGCAAPQVPVDRPRMPDGSDPLEKYRLLAKADLETWSHHIPARTLADHPQILALSGGGEDGAFGAGALNGWTARGTRPQFDIVTGISTGALMAPFAFLGPDHDDTLSDMFLNHDATDMMEMRTVSVVYSDALYDTAPLGRMIEGYTPPALLRAVARRHATGARLFVVTTALETAQATVWNMGAIAQDRQTDLFRAILRASSAIPGMFPPVGIEYESGGQTYRETHVDGCVAMQFLALPEAAYDPVEPFAPGGHLYIIVNNTLNPEPQVTSRTALGLSQQALTAMVRASAGAGLSTTRIVARQNGLELNTASVAPEIGSTWNASSRFAADYMHNLYAHGYDRAVTGRLWD